MWGLSPCFVPALLATGLLVSRLRYRNRGFTKSYPPLVAALFIAIAGIFLRDLWAYLAFFLSLGIASFGALADRLGTKTEPSSAWEPDLTESDRIAEERALQDELDDARLRGMPRDWTMDDFPR